MRDRDRAFLCGLFAILVVAIKGMGLEALILLSLGPVFVALSTAEEQ